jgi:hypothetical protein
MPNGQRRAFAMADRIVSSGSTGRLGTRLIPGEIVMNNGGSHRSVDLPLPRAAVRRARRWTRSGVTLQDLVHKRGGAPVEIG